MCNPLQNSGIEVQESQMPKLVDLLDAIAPENLINYRYGETNQTANNIKTKGTCTFHERTLTK